MALGWLQPLASAEGRAECSAQPSDISLGPVWSTVHPVMLSVTWWGICATMLSFQTAQLRTQVKRPGSQTSRAHLEFVLWRPCPLRCDGVRQTHKPEEGKEEGWKEASKQEEKDEPEGGPNTLSHCCHHPGKLLDLSPSSLAGPKH